MADEAVKPKIQDALKDGYFGEPGDAVYTLDGPEDSIHLVIVSPKFDGRRMMETHDLICGVLTARLGQEEWGKVSLSVGASPREIAST